MRPTAEAALDLPAPHLRWNPKQPRFLQATEPYVDFEGEVRAGKSFALGWKIFFYAVHHPGICCALTRWTQDGLDAQFRPLWRAVCR